MSDAAPMPSSYDEDISREPDWDDECDSEPCEHDCDDYCMDGCHHEHCWKCGGCQCPGYCDDYQTYNLRPEETGGAPAGGTQ